jgi:ArsR family transcriptional regulator, nickel/cobalt-responsive transcriptional repressor
MYQTMTDSIEASKCAELLQAIGEKNRIRIIECLWDGAKNVSQLAKLLKMEIVNVSHHLGVLKSARLVLHEKQGRFVLYSLSPDYFSKETKQGTSLNLGWCSLTIKK